MFAAHPPASSPASPATGREFGLALLRAQCRAFDGDAGFLADPAHLARIGEYLTDMVRPYQRELEPGFAAGQPVPGHSYGEMAAALIESAVPDGEPVDLLILAFSIHDLRPGRQTAAYLSHLTPGAPMAFAICDQGPAAAFTGLRIAREYASSAGIGRALLIVAEQAALPYRSPVPVPSRHQAVAMLLGNGQAPQAQQAPLAQVTGLRQHAGVDCPRAARQAEADLAELAAGHDRVGLVLGPELAALWPGTAAARVRALPPGQPCTGVWRGLLDELDGNGERPDLLVAADYDPRLRYLSLVAVTP